MGVLKFRRCSRCSQPCLQTLEDRLHCCSKVVSTLPMVENICKLVFLFFFLSYYIYSAVFCVNIVSLLLLKGQLARYGSLIFFCTGAFFVQHLTMMKGCIIFAVPLSAVRPLHKRNGNLSSCPESQALLRLGRGGKTIFYKLL